MYQHWPSNMRLSLVLWDEVDYVNRNTQWWSLPKNVFVVLFWMNIFQTWDLRAGFRTFIPKIHFKTPLFISMMSENYMLWCVESLFQLSRRLGRKGYFGIDYCAQMLKRMIIGSMSIVGYQIQGIVLTFKNKKPNIDVTMFLSSILLNCSCNLQASIYLRGFVNDVIE